MCGGHTGNLSEHPGKMVDAGKTQLFGNRRDAQIALPNQPLCLLHTQHLEIMDSPHAGAALEDSLDGGRAESMLVTQGFHGEIPAKSVLHKLFDPFKLAVVIIVLIQQFGIGLLRVS